MHEVWLLATRFGVEEAVRVQILWLENQSRQEWRSKQSAREVARVDSERRELRSSSQTKSELSRFEQIFFSCEQIEQKEKNKIRTAQILTSFSKIKRS